MPESSTEPIHPLLTDLRAVTGVPWTAEQVEALATVGPGEPAATGRPTPAPDALPDGARRPHVVMLAGNTITGDARVIKAMNTVNGFGVDVTAVGLIRPRFTPEDDLGNGMKIIRVAPGNRVSSSGARARWKRARNGLGELGTAVAPWFTNADDYKNAVARWEHRTRELSADRGQALRRAGEAGTSAQPTGAARARQAATWRWLKAERVLLKGRAAPVKLSSVRQRRAAATDTGVGRRREALIKAYTAVPGLGRWKSVLPEIIDQDLAIAPVLARLEPDVIHVHDVFMIGIAVRAAQRAALAGRTVKVVYDAHEFVPGLAMVPPKQVAAYADLERSFIHEVDRVITVSPELADLLERTHSLAERPDVVLNAPIADDRATRVVGVRDVCGLGPDVPLVVYGGGVHAARGVQTVLGALELLPDVHLAIVVRGMYAYSKELRAAADKAGYGDRVHFAPFVPPAFVPRYLSSATIGVSPLLHAINHDVAITNKFCEYLQGGLPIVTSDTPAQADLVNELGLGEVHIAGDVSDCARAIEAGLAKAPETRRRIEGDAELRHRFSWSAQAQTLRRVFDEVLPDGLPSQAWAEGATEVRELRGQ
ncbi:probable glycosyltransferase [Janibacter sp. HTCC2649]|uniref:glycosyltransferase n=1 Tax=Janibacter sp. HTCC2649 TaxID=313589 RepID=UPI000067106D|nr:glycosyltransferase [Janibacter sp. HTCC2649]EAP97487.1 probable glycosyltransferase [Janibacter sp. HTCC2649]